MDYQRIDYIKKPYGIFEISVKIELVRINLKHEPKKAQLLYFYLSSKKTLSQMITLKGKKNKGNKLNAIGLLICILYCLIYHSQQYFIINLNLYLYHRRTMIKPQAITQHLSQVKDYIISINQTCLDINALYIIQAYLTKLQASLKPNILLSSLFLAKDLETMFQLTFEQGSAYRDKLQYHQRIICEQLLKYFKLAHSHVEVHAQHSLMELGQLIQRILDSLQEWSVIGKRVKKMQGKFQRYRACRKEAEGLRNIEESLEEFLDKLLVGNNRTQFTTVQSENQSFSIQSRQTVIAPQTQAMSPFLTKEEVIQFLGYLSMWLNQLNHEICELKSVLQQAKSQSSVDERQFKLKPKKNQAKTSLLTSKLKEGQLDIPRIDHNFFDEKENHLPVVAPKRRSVWIAPMSEMECPTKVDRKLSHRVILGNFTSSHPNKKQKVPQTKIQSCSQCQIY